MIAALALLLVLGQARHQANHLAGNCANSKHLGSNQNGNYIWAGAMNIAWNQLVEEVIKEPIQLKTSDNVVQSMVSSLNCPVLTKSDLNERSYYAKAGYGPKTVTEIKSAIKEKFPESTMPELNENISNTTIIAYAYLFKKVKYLEKFEKMPEFTFDGKQVAGFVASNREQKKQISLHTYSNDDNFLLEIQTEDPNSQLFLYKTEQNLSIETVASKLVNITGSGWRIKSWDQFRAPVIKINAQRTYTEIIGKELANKAFPNYVVSEMKERIKFDMDQQGVKVENDAEINIKLTSARIDNQPKPRLLYLNKPFWVILKQKGKHPFLIAKIVNPQ